MGHNKWTIVVLVNLPKKYPFQKKGHFGSKVAQSYSHDLSQRFFLKNFSMMGMMGHNRLKKLTLVSFLPEILF